MTSENTVPAYDRVTEQHWDKSVDRWETETSPLYALVWRISASRCTLVTVWGSVVYLCKNIQTVEWTKFLQISWFWDEILQWIKNHKRQSPLDSIHTSESLYETSMERCDMPSTFHFNTRYLCVMKQLLVYTIIANLSEGLKKTNCFYAYLSIIRTMISVRYTVPYFHIQWNSSLPGTRGVFMLQMSTLPLREPCRWLVKN